MSSIPMSHRESDKELMRRARAILTNGVYHADGQIGQLLVRYLKGELTYAQAIGELEADFPKGDRE